MMNTLKLIAYLQKLSEIKRTGWKRLRITDPESVAEHSFEAVILGWQYAVRLGYDADKVIKLLLIHDLGESIIGDIVLYRGGRLVSSVEKKEAIEKKAIRKIATVFADKKEVQKLCVEYAQGASKEAELALQVDKLQMALRAFTYEKRYKKNLEEFWQTAQSFITIPFLLKDFKKIYAKRKVS